uniref:MFS transporter n=1 Tax=Subtercola endophyticus TaxID=2895559 RepID=UPI0036F1F447
MNSTTDVISDRQRDLLSRPLRPRLITAVLALAGLSASFMSTLVIPIQPQLPQLLGASKDDTTWVITATLLSAAIITPIAGRLGDLYGKRRVVIVLLGVLVIGSVICAFSTSLVPMIVGRALQGAVTGVIPLGIAILRDVLHRDKLGGAIALVSATLGVGGALGLPISALIIQNFDWHAIFWLSVVLALVVLVLVVIVVPPSVLRSPGTFDLVGAIGLAIGLSAILLAVSKGSSWGWASVETIGCAAGGLAVLVVWALYELRQASPLVDLRVAARPAVLRTNLASIAMGFALFGNSIAFPQLLELPVASGVGLGLGILAASLVMMPSGLAMMAMSPVSARLISTFGARILLAVGACLLAVSYILALFLMTAVWQILLVAIIAGFGAGLGYAAMPTLIMQSVPATESAAANGLNALMRSLGTTIAAAVIGSILATVAVQVGSISVPTVGGFRLVFAIAAAVSLGSAVIALTIPRHEEHYEEQPALPD